MRESATLTSLEACAADWWRVQGRLASAPHPIRQILSRLTNGLFRGPWAQVAFDAGWTREDLFGISAEPFGLATADEFSGGAVTGLVPMMAVSTMRPVILNIEGSRATLMCRPDQSGKCVAVIDRKYLGGRRVVWWRHSMWLAIARVGAAVH